MLVFSMNIEMENFFWYGEVYIMKKFYEFFWKKCFNFWDCIFFVIYEFCLFCLLVIIWGGYDNFYYFFSFEDFCDLFNIFYDLCILKEVFKVENGDYFYDNYYWKSYDLVKLVDGY